MFCFPGSRRFLHQIGYKQISSSMGMFVYGATTFTIGLIWVSYLKVTGQSLLITQAGFIYAMAAGLAFGFVTILLYLTFAHISVSLGSPTIRVMGIVIASLLGIFLLHEPITWRYVLGVLLTIAGVALIVLR